jgi:hypothetical protein
VNGQIAAHKLRPIPRRQRLPSRIVGAAVHTREQSIASPPRPEEGLASGDNGGRRSGEKIILLALFLFVLWVARSYLVAAHGER